MDDDRGKRKVPDDDEASQLGAGAKMARAADVDGDRVVLGRGAPSGVHRHDVAGTTPADGSGSGSSGGVSSMGSSQDLPERARLGGLDVVANSIDGWILVGVYDPVPHDSRPPQSPPRAPARPPGTRGRGRGRQPTRPPGAPARSPGPRARAPRGRGRAPPRQQPQPAPPARNLEVPEFMQCPNCRLRKGMRKDHPVPHLCICIECLLRNGVCRTCNPTGYQPRGA